MNLYQGLWCSQCIRSDSRAQALLLKSEPVFVPLGSQLLPRIASAAATEKMRMLSKFWKNCTFLWSQTYVLQIFVEIERARLTRKLAGMKESEGSIAEAADILQEVAVVSTAAIELDRPCCHCSAATQTQFL